MKSIFIFRLVVLSCAALAVSAPAQNNGRGAPPSAQAIDDALAFRGEMARNVASGVEKPADAIARLGQRADAMGFGFEAKTDFLLAATDIGQRLISQEKTAEAQPFFRAAEQATDEALQRNRGGRAEDRARLHAHRAFLRETYLNKSAEAASDLAEAVRLQPEDKELREKRDLLAARHTRRAEAGKKR